MKNFTLDFVKKIISKLFNIDSLLFLCENKQFNKTVKNVFFF